MLGIDLSGKLAFVAGVGDDRGYGWAITKALAAAGARHRRHRRRRLRRRRRFGEKVVLVDSRRPMRAHKSKSPASGKAKAQGRSQPSRHSQARE